MTATASAEHFAAFESMVLKEHEPSDIPLWVQTMLIFGEYGSGKSTLAAAFPNHAYFDIEHGAANIGHAPAPSMVFVDGQWDGQPLKNTWKEFDRFVDVIFRAAKAGKQLPFKTLIIDTADELMQLCIKSVWADRGWKSAEDGDRGAGWTEPRAEFKRVVGKLMMLHKHGKLGTVFLAHESKEDVKVGLTYAAEVATVKLTDKDIAVWLPSQVQMVLRAVKTNVSPVNAADVWPERRFILQASAGEAAARVKDRTGRLPSWLSTSYASLEKAYG